MAHTARQDTIGLRGRIQDHVVPTAWQDIVHLFGRTQLHLGHSYGENTVIPPSRTGFYPRDYPPSTCGDRGCIMPQDCTQRVHHDAGATTGVVTAEVPVGATEGEGTGSCSLISDTGHSECSPVLGSQGIRTRDTECSPVRELQDTKCSPDPGLPDYETKSGHLPSGHQTPRHQGFTWPQDLSLSQATYELNNENLKFLHSILKNENKMYN